MIDNIQIQTVGVVASENVKVPRGIFLYLVQYPVYWTTRSALRFTPGDYGIEG